MASTVLRIRPTFPLTLSSANPLAISGLPSRASSTFLTGRVFGGKSSVAWLKRCPVIQTARPAATVAGGEAELAGKRCVPCENKSIQPLTVDSAQAMLIQVPGWEILVKEDGILRLHREYKVRNFLKGLELFKRVASLAEAEGHHPDLHLTGWNNVSLDLWTHSIGGLHENDFIMAAKISALDVEDLIKQRQQKKVS